MRLNLFNIDSTSFDFYRINLSKNLLINSILLTKSVYKKKADSMDNIRAQDFNSDAVFFFNGNDTLIRNHGQHNESQVDLLFIFSITSNILSIVGSLFNMSTTVILKITHHTLGKMVVALSAMDLIYNFLNVLTDITKPNEFLCAGEGAIMFFGFGGSLFWSCCFAHSLYINVKCSNIEVLDTYFKRYTLLSLVAAVSVSGSALISRFTVLTENGCGHQTPPNEFDVSLLVVFILPVALAVVFCLFCYVMVINGLRMFKDRLHLELLVYPLILIVCYFPYISLSLYKQIAHDPGASSDFLILANILTTSQGFLNAFAYGLSRRILDGYKKKCCATRNPSTLSVPLTIDTSSITISSRHCTSLDSPKYVKESDT